MSDIRYNKERSMTSIILRTTLCVAFGATIGYTYNMITIDRKCDLCVAKNHSLSSSQCNDYINRFRANADILAPSVGIDTLFVSMASMNWLLGSASEGFRYYYVLKNNRLRLVITAVTCNTANKKYDDVRALQYVFPETAVTSSAQYLDSAECSAMCRAYGDSSSYSSDKKRGGFFCKKAFTDYVAANPTCQGFKIYFAATNNTPIAKTIVMRGMLQADNETTVHFKTGFEMSSPCPDICGTSLLW